MAKRDVGDKDYDAHTKKRKHAVRMAFSLQRAANSDVVAEEWLSARGLYVAFGQFLYRLGYETEYYLIVLGRTFTMGAIAAYKGFRFAITKFLAVLQKIVSILTMDLAEPFNRAKIGFKHIADVVRQEKEVSSGTQAAKKGAAYFVRGLIAYKHLALNLASYLLPICAALIFVYTAKTITGYTFALAVEYNGETIGIIDNENIYDEAQNQVRSRIKGTDSANEWTANASFNITATEAAAISTRSEIADNIISLSTADFQQATGVEVSGELVSVVTDASQIQTLLDEKKSQYYDAAKPDMRVEFVKDIKLEPGLYLTSSLQDVQGVVDMLGGEVAGEKLYTIVKNDSPILIAQKNNIPLKDLHELNPEMLENGYKMPIGSQLKVAQQENFLQVKTIETITYSEVITHEIERKENAEMLKNKSKTLQSGSDGERVITADITKIDGVEIERNILEQVVTIEPVTEIVEVGIKSTFSTQGSAVGSGSFVHPVPNRTYVTTRFGQGGHRGIDICAPSGTPIYACDSGTVIEAGYHGSFGNFILISHGNGMTTRYCHCSQLWVTGGTVSRGQPIAAVGQTGYASGNHLHLEVTSGGVRINPGPLIGE